MSDFLTSLDVEDIEFARKGKRASSNSEFALFLRNVQGLETDEQSSRWVIQLPADGEKQKRAVQKVRAYAQLAGKNQPHRYAVRTGSARNKATGRTIDVAVVSCVSRSTQTEDSLEETI
jgi:hypothetical protein